MKNRCKIFPVFSLGRNAFVHSSLSTLFHSFLYFFLFGSLLRWNVKKGVNDEQRT